MHVNVAFTGMNGRVSDSLPPFLLPRSSFSSMSATRARNVTPPLSLSSFFFLFFFKSAFQRIAGKVGERSWRRREGRVGKESLHKEYSWWEYVPLPTIGGAGTWNWDKSTTCVAGFPEGRNVPSLQHWCRLKHRLASETGSCYIRGAAQGCSTFPNFWKDKKARATRNRGDVRIFVISLPLIIHDFANGKYRDELINWRMVRKCVFANMCKIGKRTKSEKSGEDS